MVDASDILETQLDDPTLASLVPQRSSLRNLAVVLATALVLAGAWFSPALFQPNVHDSAEGGAASLGATVFDGDRGVTVSSMVSQGPGELVISVRLNPDVFGSPTLMSVSDVPGATVAGAWLFNSDTVNFDGDLETFDVDESGQIIEADVDFDDSTALPQKLTRGGTKTLIVLWDVHDCAALEFDLAPEAEIRTLIGTTVASALPEITSPANWNSGCLS